MLGGLRICWRFMRTRCLHHRHIGGLTRSLEVVALADDYRLRVFVWCNRNVCRFFWAFWLVCSTSDSFLGAGSSRFRYDGADGLPEWHQLS